MDLLAKIILVVFLLIFFYLLGQSADIVVNNLKKLGRKIGLNMYFLGLILGFFTSLPELTVGVNSVINKIEAVSFGNLFGGTLVVLGLIFGLNIALNRKIKTTGHGNNFLFVLLLLIMPIILGLDGLFGIIDGIILIGMYILLIYKMYKSEKGEVLEESKPIKRNMKKIYMNIFWIFAGITGLVIFSTLIVNTTELLLAETRVSKFTLGLILFSLGTNLPEVTIVLRSFKNHHKDISYSNLLGSAAANPFIIGILSFIHPLSVTIGPSFMLMAFFTLTLLVSLYIFYRTGNKFTTKEGLVLIWIYTLFLFFEIFSQIQEAQT